MATLQHTDELYHILEDEICALKILPGEALSENQLCKRFGVSRTPIPVSYTHLTLPTTERV